MITHNYIRQPSIQVNSKLFNKFYMKKGDIEKNATNGKYKDTCILTAM